MRELSNIFAVLVLTFSTVNDFSKNVNPDSRSLYALCMKSELGTNNRSCHKKEQEAEWARGSQVFHRVQVRLLEVRRLPLCF